MIERLSCFQLSSIGAIPWHEGASKHTSRHTHGCAADRRDNHLLYFQTKLCGFLFSSGYPTFMLSRIRMLHGEALPAMLGFWSLAGGVESGELLVENAPHFFFRKKKMKSYLCTSFFRLFQGANKPLLVVSLVQQGERRQVCLSRAKRDNSHHV